MLSSSAASGIFPYLGSSPMADGYPVHHQGSLHGTNLKGKIRKYHTVSQGNRKWGLAAHCSKAHEEPRLMGRSLLYFGCQAVQGLCVCES